MFTAFMAALRNRGHSGGNGSRQVKCLSCNHDILVGWRLCPYCGALLENDIRPAMFAKSDTGDTTKGVGDGKHREPSL